MILAIEEKSPPPYTRRGHDSLSIHSASTHSTSTGSRREAALNRLPTHVLLQVIYWTCPDGLSGEGRRMMLYWMSSSLRYVCRSFWIATMHVLRSSYLPLYTRHILPPFTSDPFPRSAQSVLVPGNGGSSTPAASSSTSSPSYSAIPTGNANMMSIISTQRETAVLDLFIVIRSRQDMREDESELYLDNDDERYRDMFNYVQPRARLEDLVHKFGLRYDLIAPTPRPSTSPSPSRTSSNAPSPTPSYSTIPIPLPNSLSSPSYSSLPPPPTSSSSNKPSFSSLSITWTNRSASLCSKDAQGRRRVIVEVERERGETLEALARKIVGDWWRDEMGRRNDEAQAQVQAQAQSNGSASGSGTRPASRSNSGGIRSFWRR